MEVHRDPPVASGPGEMPARTRGTSAEFDLLFKNVIEQALSVKLDTQIQEAGEHWRKSTTKLTVDGDWSYATNGACKFILAIAVSTVRMPQFSSAPQLRRWTSTRSRWRRRWKRPSSR